MLQQPPGSRNQLGWHVFEQREDGSWHLVLPPYYASLFGQLNPSLMQKSNSGWRWDKSERYRFAFFNQLDEQEIGRVEAFTTDFGRYVVIGRNKNIEAHFSRELDFCLALDYNFNKAGLPQEGQRTPVGQLENRAKYGQDVGSIERLVEHLLRAFNAIPRVSNSRKCITYMPSPPWKRHRFYLPRTLATALVDNRDSLGIEGPETHLVHAYLTSKKRSSKNSRVEDKLAEWARVIEKDALKLSAPVANQVVYVVDDLYQSGTALWSFAKYLKLAGASHVLGLVCVKSLRDSDNL